MMGSEIWGFMSFSRRYRVWTKKEGDAQREEMVHLSIGLG